MNDLQVFQPIITFDAYNSYLERANEVANFINSMELTEDNVKECKKVVADARKVVNGLEDRRKAVKKEILKPYEDFERQVKNITSVIDIADARLREQIKALEEKERLEKKEALIDIWDKRIVFYDFPTYVKDGFSKWLKPQYLNKTESIKKVEANMTSWMEDRENDINSILSLPDATEILVEYNNTLNVSEAIMTVSERKKSIVEVSKNVSENTKIEPTKVFRITGEKDIKLAEILLNTNNINFEII